VELVPFMFFVMRHFYPEFLVYKGTKMGCIGILLSCYPLHVFIPLSASTQSS